MQYLRRAGVIVAVAACLVAAAGAQSKATATMAGILMKLNHFPNDDDKKALNAIVDDKATTAPEKTVAQAMLNVQHKVSDADKPKLEALVKDDKTPAGVKTLANVLLKLNHTPSDAEKAELKKLAGA